MTWLERYIKEGFKTVDGWGIDSELIELFILVDQFQKKENVSGPLCEIGVHHGRTLILLGLLANSGEKVVGIDLFEDGQEHNLDLSGSGSYKQLKKNTDIHAPGINFEIVKGNSFRLTNDVLKIMRDSRIFHIDGGHFFEVVLNDLTIAQDIVGLGGVIVIDDYWHSGFPEVQEAVHRYFWSSSNLKAIPFAVGKNKIFLVGCAYKSKILNYFKERLPQNKKKTVRVMGYEAICIDSH
jgi:hypothetical protein